MDPAIQTLVGGTLVILLIGLVLRALRQPHVVSYLIAGVLIGPEVLGILTDELLLDRLGLMGMILLLFFIGMEISPRRLVLNWKIPVIGTLLQILISTGCVWFMGHWLQWSIGRIVLIGFVISLSSTAVVLKILRDRGEIETDVGQDVLGILLVQDFAVIPMLVVMGVLAESGGGTGSLFLQIVGALLMFFLLMILSRKESVHLPLGRLLGSDPEMQVFAGLAICFGLALISGFFGLSAPLGAFMAGILISSARETRWVHHSLEPFRVVFVAIFFVSIGALADLAFLVEEWKLILLLTLIVMLTNTFINASALRLFGDPWPETLYAGALLAQIGEFSFILAAVGKQSEIISEFGYQLVIGVITASLFISPFWISAMKLLIGAREFRSM
jgi:CPA2 family monovalent cation:H+ antiporter-2